MKNSSSGPKWAVSAIFVCLRNLAALRAIERVAAVFLLGNRVAHVADQRQRGVHHERVDLGGVSHRHQQHVGLIDRLPAADAGPVEAEPVVEAFQGEFADRAGGVLPQPGEVHETQVEELDFFLLDQLEHVTGRHSRLS